MALHDVPLGDAGRDYYARQFDGRIQNIRKSGGPAPSAKPGCLGVGGGVFAVFIIIRLIIALASGLGDSGSGSYNNTSYTPPPPDWQDPPPVRPDFRGPDFGNPPVDGGPGLDQPNDPDAGQPDKPFVLPPDNPLVVPPDDPPADPPAGPDDDQRPDRDK